MPRLVDLDGRGSTERGGAAHAGVNGEGGSSGQSRPTDVECGRLASRGGGGGGGGGWALTSCRAIMSAPLSSMALAKWGKRSVTWGGLWNTVPPHVPKSLNRSRPQLYVSILISEADAGVAADPSAAAAAGGAATAASASLSTRLAMGGQLRCRRTFPDESCPAWCGFYRRHRSVQLTLVGVGYCCRPVRTRTVQASRTSRMGLTLGGGRRGVSRWHGVAVCGAAVAPELLHGPGVSLFTQDTAPAPIPRARSRWPSPRRATFPSFFVNLGPGPI